MLDNPRFIRDLYHIARRLAPEQTRRTIKVAKLQLRIIDLMRGGVAISVWKGPEWSFELHTAALIDYTVENVRGDRQVIEDTLMLLRMMG